MNNKTVYNQARLASKHQYCHTKRNKNIGHTQSKIITLLLNANFDKRVIQFLLHQKQIQMDSANSAYVRYLDSRTTLLTSQATHWCS